MKGVHDLGGKTGFGAVDRDIPSQPFDSSDAGRWEARVFTIMRAAFANNLIKNTDQFRHGIERIDPQAYLQHGYYGRWLAGVETLLVESGDLDPTDLDRRVIEAGGSPALPGAKPNPLPDKVNYLPAGRTAARDLDRPCPLAVGDWVVTRLADSTGHTRLPEYAEGKRGQVVALHGGWVLPDDNAHGRGENPEHLVTVKFLGAALWGSANPVEPGLEVHLDLFESYLTKDTHVSKERDS